MIGLPSRRTSRLVAAALDVATGDLNVAGNVLKSGNLFLHNSGGFVNTFLGIQAGNGSMTGLYNTATGFQALFSNTIGTNNTAHGVGALYSNTIGSYNTAIGIQALAGNSDGHDNTASGYQALNNNNGSYNTASGVQALVSNSTGYYNTASGYQALFYNQDGSYNAANGDAALFNNIHGSDNTASGEEALFSNTTGGANTAMGVGALRSNTTGFLNTAIGAYADVAFPNLHNATAIGDYASVDASNKIRLGDDFVSVIEGRVPYTFTSDKNQKENFQPVDGEAVLRKLGGLSLTSWNYIGHDPQQLRHYGPVAQEFFAAFGQDAVGTIGTSTTINSGDLEGILMVAVQALEKRTAENADLRARIEALEKLVKRTTIEGQ
jgi:hypothetical protein